MTLSLSQPPGRAAFRAHYGRRITSGLGPFVYKQDAVGQAEHVQTRAMTCASESARV